MEACHYIGWCIGKCPLYTGVGALGKCPLYGGVLYSLSEVVPPYYFILCRGQVLKALMEQRDSGAIPGIHGRLGDLGAIDEKYDVAVSTACWALDHIVVDTMDTAMRCVEFLKKRNVGLATFIGLDKVSYTVDTYSSTVEPLIKDTLNKGHAPTYIVAVHFCLQKRTTSL